MKEDVTNIYKSKYLKTLEKVTDNGMLNLLLSYEKICNKPIESYQDLERILRFLEQSLNHFKRQQYIILKIINDLKYKNLNDEQLIRWKSLFTCISCYKAMYLQSIEFFAYYLDMYKYEPDQLADPKIKDELNNQYQELINEWIYFLLKRYN